MRRFSVQMTGRSVPPRWWRQLMGHFARPGDPFEIRCWREETAEIAEASRYGIAAAEGYEVSVKGIVTKELLNSWLTGEPRDRSVYNKMTAFFTIHVENDRCDLWSEHYGTEMTLSIREEADAGFFLRVMEEYPEDFSIGEF